MTAQNTIIKDKPEKNIKNYRLDCLRTGNTNEIALCVQQEASTAATRPLQFVKLLSLVIVFGKGSKV